MLDYVDQLLLLPLNQQALRNEQNEKRVDELSEGSLRILDVCNATKNALAEIKDSAQQLQSILRRRRGAESDLTREAKKFLASRKMAKKEIQKAMKNFNRIEKGEKCDEIVSILREVESIALGVFESLFSFMFETKSQKSSSRSLVSKLMISKRVVCEEVNEPNEFECADAELKLLISAKKSDGLVEEKVQKKLQKLEICIQDFEENVENIYRRLIKTRVSMLNIVTH